MFKVFFRTVAAAVALIGASTLPVYAQQGATIRETDDMAIPKYEARFGRARPVIAVVGFNAATEVIRRADHGIRLESSGARK